MKNNSTYITANKKSQAMKKASQQIQKIFLEFQNAKQELVQKRKASFQKEIELPRRKIYQIFNF